MTFVTLAGLRQNTFFFNKNTVIKLLDEHLKRKTAQFNAALLEYSPLFPFFFIGCRLRTWLDLHTVVLERSSLRKQLGHNEDGQLHWYHNNSRNKQTNKRKVIPVTFLESEEAKFFLGGLMPMVPGPPLNADSSNQEGTSCWACQSQST